MIALTRIRYYPRCATNGSDDATTFGRKFDDTPTRTGILGAAPVSASNTLIDNNESAFAFNHRAIRA